MGLNSRDDHVSLSKCVRYPPAECRFLQDAQVNPRLCSIEPSVSILWWSFEVVSVHSCS
jgi:hypothetical protein